MEPNQGHGEGGRNSTESGPRAAFSLQLRIRREMGTVVDKPDPVFL